jgi:hypothetical protein
MHGREEVHAKLWTGNLKRGDNLRDLDSAICLKKIGSETHSGPNFGWREGGVSYVDSKK